MKKVTNNELIDAVAPIINAQASGPRCMLAEYQYLVQRMRLELEYVRARKLRILDDPLIGW